MRRSRLARRDLMAALGGFAATLPARAEQPPAKLSQTAAAYQTTAKGMFSCAVCTFFIRPRSCQGGERRYQPDRLVQAVRHAGLTG
jgi:hypothetical protein